MAGVSFKAAVPENANKMSAGEAKQKFIAELGEGAWDQSWASVARLSPEILDASIKLSAVPRHKNHLSRKIQEFVSISVYSASTHFYVPWDSKAHQSCPGRRRNAG